MSEIDIRWKNGDDWVEFPVSDISHLPVRHACHLFSGKLPVIAKQNGHYFVNSPDLQKQYRVRKFRVTTFAELLERGGDRLEQKLSVGGFV